MSVFFCNGCNAYLDSDIAGYHSIEDDCFLCDDCECRNHDEHYHEMIDQLRMMVKLGIR